MVYVQGCFWSFIPSHELRASWQALPLQNKRSRVTITVNVWLVENSCFQLAQRFSVSFIPNGLAKIGHFRRCSLSPVLIGVGILGEFSYVKAEDTLWVMTERFVIFCSLLSCNRIFCKGATDCASCFQICQKIQHNFKTGSLSMWWVGSLSAVRLISEFNEPRIEIGLNKQILLNLQRKY